MNEEKIVLGIGMYSPEITRDIETEAILKAGKYGFNKVISDTYSDEKVYLLHYNTTIPHLNTASPESLEKSIKNAGYKIVDVIEWSKTISDKEFSNKITIEIEDYHGNTDMAFQIDVSNVNNPIILKTQDCTHANTENDYVFSSSDSLIRIQSNHKGRLSHYILRDSDSDSNWSEVFYTDAPVEEIDKAIEYAKTIEDYNNDMIFNILRAIGYEVVLNQPKEFLY